MDEQSFQQEAALSGSVINEHEQNAVEAAEEVDTKPSGRLGLSSVPGLDELWAQVSTDFTDFDCWTKLLAKSESCEDIKEVMQAYDVFLDRYCLCFGYWKKYADILKKRGHSNEDVTKIFERGVVAIPLSVDLWIHYINYACSTLYVEKTEQNVMAIRNLFERGVGACGWDYKSDRLWDMFVNWERDIAAASEPLSSSSTADNTSANNNNESPKGLSPQNEVDESQEKTEQKEVKKTEISHGRFVTVTALYDRLFKVPTLKHAEHFQNLFERGVGACGWDYKSDRLWDMFVNWERDIAAASEPLSSSSTADNTSANNNNESPKGLSPQNEVDESQEKTEQKEVKKTEISHGRFVTVTALYDRLFKVPTLKHAEHFQKFQTFVGCEKVEEVVSKEELIGLVGELLVKEAAGTDDDKDGQEDRDYDEEKDETDAKMDSDSDTTGENSAVTDAERETEAAVEAAVKIVNAEAAAKHFAEIATSENVQERIANLASEDQEPLKMLVIKRRSSVFEALKSEIEKMAPFESQLRRNYFHVKPLERGQLKTWNDYLDSFMTRENLTGAQCVSRERVLFLFERCVITCCYYEEYWLKYITYLESKGLIEEAREVFSRAGRTHLPKKITFHLEWAMFEEKHGFKESAVKVLTNLESFHPDVIKIPVLKAGVYRRMWSLSKACEALQSAINASSTRDHIVFFSLKLARFKAKVEGDFSGAMEVLQQALKKYPVNEKLHLCVIDLEYSARQVINVSSFCDACDTVISNNQIASHTRIAFCQRKLELLEDVGTDLAEIVVAREEYSKLTKELKWSEGGGGSSTSMHDGEPPEKKAKLAGGVGLMSNGTNGMPAPNGDMHDPNAMAAATTAAHYPNYYYPWPYYGSQQQYPPQQYPAQYWAPVTAHESSDRIGLDHSMVASTSTADVS